MKRSIWALGMLGAVLSAVAPAIAMADNCVTSSGDGYVELPAQALSALLASGMACYPAGGPPWTNQEYHAGSGTGAVTDYKLGPPAPGNKDPTATIGTYTISGTGKVGQIVYTYTAGGTFTYTVWGTQSSGSGTYDFCNGATPLPGRVKVIANVGGVVSCGS
jgi:hypothetical protein